MAFFLGYNRDYGTIKDYNRDIVGYHQVSPKMLDFPPQINLADLGLPW